MILTRLRWLYPVMTIPVNGLPWNTLFCEPDNGCMMDQDGLSITCDTDVVALSSRYPEFVELDYRIGVHEIPQRNDWRF